jgi:hypothetical protein
MSTRAFCFLFVLLALVPSAVYLRAQNADSHDAKAQAPATTPDFSGVWSRRGGPNMRYLGYGFQAEELPMTPWALEKYKANKPSFGPHMVADTNDPTYDCYLPGLPRIYAHPTLFEFVHTHGRVLQFFEYDNVLRQIWTDGRQHPKEIDPDERLWMGDSIGHWEGDILVIDTTGFNDKTWLDRAGHPHSDELHVTERFQRTAHENLRLDLTIEDPKAYTKPITSTINYQLRPDWKINEHACTEYPRPQE